MLPKIDLPIFETTLPSNGEKVKYRAFTVKEEKILLVAQESNDIGQTILAIKQVVNNCVLSHDVAEFAMFDLEYMMLMIRARAVDDTVKFVITDTDTDKPVNLELALDDVQVVKSDEHKNEVAINEEYNLYLKYPTIDQFIRIVEMDQRDPLVNYTIMISCLDKVASEDEVHEFKNYSEKEIDQFMENVDTKVLKGIQKFFETMPKLKHEVHYENENGDSKVYTVEGINSFFF